MAGFTYAEVFIFDSMLLESLSERLYTEIEHALLFITSLSDEQIVHLVVCPFLLSSFLDDNM